MQKNNLNKIILIGRLGNNPEGRYTQKGRSVVSFSLATNESWKNKEGKQIEHTEWHSIVAWDQLADFAKESLFKGQLVCVEGCLRSRTWDDKQYPIKRKAIEVLSTSLFPLERKHEKDGPGKD